MSSWPPARFHSFHRSRHRQGRSLSLSHDDDLERIIAHAKGVQDRLSAVIGGGLLGLEAAKASYDLGLENHVIEFALGLMPRQVDDPGSRLLVQKIEVTRGESAPAEIDQGNPRRGSVEKMVYTDRLHARRWHDCRLSRYPPPRRIGPQVAASKSASVAAWQLTTCCKTSDERIYAIGEVALQSGDGLWPRGSWL